MKNDVIYIIGLMGSGKTSVGRMLAKKTNKKFFDIDQIIIEKEQMSISEIFSQKNEKYFRDLEFSILEEMQHNKNCVISTGGGIILREENIKIMKQTGYIVFLDITINTQLQRVRNKENRPLLKNANIKESLKKLRDQRIKIYENISDIIIDTSKNNQKIIADKIIKKLQL